VFEKIDSILLAACTRFSHSLQRTTGLTNYFVAKIGVILVSVSMIVNATNYLSQFLYIKTSILTVCFDGGMLLLMVGRSLDIARAEDQLWSGRRTKPAELMKYIGLWPCRLLWIMFLSMDVWWFWFRFPLFRYQLLEFADGTFFTLGSAIFYYFIAVDPLPPGRSKIRALIEKFGMAQTPLPAES